MGYYSTISDTELQVLDSKWEQFKVDTIKLIEKFGELENTFVPYFLTESRLDDDHHTLCLRDCTEKFYYVDEFIGWFARYAKEQEVVFTGEDGVMWGYYIDGNGEIYDISWVKRVSEEPMEHEYLREILQLTDKILKS